MVVSQETEQDSLLLSCTFIQQTRNLLQIAIYNISYIRGLFHEKYFSDKSVTALEMKTKKLMPMDAQSRRLIQWMEKEQIVLKQNLYGLSIVLICLCNDQLLDQTLGVYDALQKKYLKTLLFCICEKEEGPVIEEYSFSFGYPSDNTIELEMMMSCSGYKGGTTFSTNASEVTPDQMRYFLTLDVDFLA
nr:unnamed protein product [Digitaria exilis]